MPISRKARQKGKTSRFSSDEGHFWRTCLQRKDSSQQRRRKANTSHFNKTSNHDHNSLAQQRREASTVISSASGSGTIPQPSAVVEQANAATPGSLINTRGLRHVPQARSIQRYHHLHRKPRRSWAAIRTQRRIRRHLMVVGTSVSCFGGQPSVTTLPRPYAPATSRQVHG